MKIKNILNVAAVSLLVFGVSSCAKEEIGGTAVQDMCGEWYVVADAVDAAGNVVIEDFFDLGYFTLMTYNTNANLSTEMYIDDFGTFWDMKVVVPVDYANKSFNGKDIVVYYDEDEDGNVYPVNCNIWDGKVVKDGTKSPAGYVADSISFMVSFEDDPYAERYGYDHWWVHGYRRTGLDGGYD